MGISNTTTFNINSRHLFKRERLTSHFGCIFSPLSINYRPRTILYHVVGFHHKYVIIFHPPPHTFSHNSPKLFLLQIKFMIVSTRVTGKKLLWLLYIISKMIDFGEKCFRNVHFVFCINFTFFFKFEKTFTSYSRQMMLR